jgi:hypothetical protein
LSGVNVLGWGFADPDNILVDGPDLFVANTGGLGTSSLSEVDISSGKLVRSISAPEYRFAGPRAMLLEGATLFVVNTLGRSVTEVNAATGGLVRVLSGPGYGFNRPLAMVLDGPDLFVANESLGGPGSLTEVNAATGAPVKVLSGRQYGFDEPQALALDGTELFVANFAGGIYSGPGRVHGGETARGGIQGVPLKSWTRMSRLSSPCLRAVCR